MSKELEVAIKAAQEAGKILKKGWEEEIVIDVKADDSLVTKIDGQSEEAIIAIIKGSFPNHRIVAEESGESGASEFTWFIDPIDGTTNYSRKIPLCAVSLALAENGEVLVGVIFNPFTNELYSAEKGQGTSLNDLKIHTSTIDDLAKAVISVSYSHDASLRGRVANMISLITSNRTKREYGSVAYELALLASGRLDAVICVGHKSWDFAAGSLLITEAGGVITEFDGTDLETESQLVLAAANPTLHTELKDSLKNF